MVKSKVKLGIRKGYDEILFSVILINIIAK